MYTVYALYNLAAEKIYIGQTKDLINRLNLHENKRFKNSYTAKLKGEWILIYSESVASRDEALRREKQLKSYRGREFVKKYIPR